MPNNSPNDLMPPLLGVMQGERCCRLRITLEISFETENRQEIISSNLKEEHSTQGVPIKVNVMILLPSL
jgi:hypothetical protein